MVDFNELLDILDIALDSKSKRHIAGGMLMSISLLFGGLAFTVMTIRREERNHE